MGMNGQNGTTMVVNGKHGGGANGTTHETTREMRERETRQGLIDFLRTELTRQSACAERFELVQLSALRAASFVNDWEAKGKAEELAEQIYAAAARDSSEGPEPSVSGSYAVVSHREAGSSARFTFRTPASVRMDLRSIEPPELAGQKAQSMRHLNERHESANVLLMELLEQGYAGRTLELETMRAIAKEYGSLLEGATKSSDRTIDRQLQIIDRQGAQMATVLDKHFEILSLFEDLTSQRHSRDLESRRDERKAARGDKLFDTFFPVIVGAIGKKLAGGATSAAAAATSTAKASADAATAAGADAATEPAPKVPEFTDAQKLALGLFLQALNQTELVAVYNALTDRTRDLFEAVVRSFQKKEEPPK